MQKWRQWETASDVDWGLAVRREFVIRLLAAKYFGKVVERTDIASVYELWQRFAGKWAASLRRVIVSWAFAAGSTVTRGSMARSRTDSA
jgi:hypothetical protein